jgi:DNA-directed RNA polymerase specialized sigma subunit
MKKPVKGTNKNISCGQIEKELDSIKKLIVFLLLKAGASQEEVGTVLEIDQSTISKWFPKPKKFDCLSQTKVK